MLCVGAFLIMTNREIFIIEAFLLSRANIEQWDKFLRAYKNYINEDILIEAVKATDSYKQNINCGRAQAHIDMFGDLAVVDVHYNKIRSKIGK